MVIIPGVTGSSSEPYIKEICGIATQQGYTAVVVNCLYTKDSDKNQRVLDPSNSLYIQDSVDFIRNQVGLELNINPQQIDMYGVGFSLGANHLLRFLGAHETYQSHGLKAAISISNPYDVIAATIGLRSRFFGIYDKSIKTML